MPASGLPLQLLADVDWTGHMDLDGWGWVLMTLGMIAFWGLLIYLVLGLIREPGRRVPGSGSEAADAGATEPAAILDRRLAEGDISIEEHRERRRVIAGPTGAPDSDEESA